MTQELVQISVLGLLSVIFTTVLKRYFGELSVLLTMIASFLIGLFILRLFQPILSFMEELRVVTGLDRTLLDPVLKCLGIALVSQICVNVCIDAGQSAVGKMIQVSGCVLCLYVTIPLFRGILSLVGQLGT